MNKYNNTSMEKYLSLLLRHHPEKLNLNMSEDGWVEINEIIYNLKKLKNETLTIEQIKEIVNTSSKQRFDIKIENNVEYIRANQGHSININMNFKPVNPPDVLYHGTGEKYINSIFKTGLKPKTRQYVHLSPDIKTATSVGERHGKVKIIEINSKQMSEDGIKFYLSKNGIWLTKYIDTKYINLLK